MSGLEVLSCGLYATIQDSGRRGQLAFGITEGGAVDGFAYRLGNQLVGNDPGLAAVEVVTGGIEVRATDELQIAVTGALVTVSVNDDIQPMNTTLNVEAGQIIKLGRAEAGNFSYLAVAGGIDVEPVLGSRSTVEREQLGGLNGRPLAPGDVLPFGSSERVPLQFAGKPKSVIGSELLELRYLPGFQFDAFANGVIHLFEKASYTITSQRNRMGARLSGPELNTGLGQLWSEATCLGAVQIPPDGQPIVLLNDRQTVGGYPKPGAILSVDCVRLAQAPLGSKVRFSRVTLSEADRVLWLHRNYGQELQLESLGELR